MRKALKINLWFFFHNHKKDAARRQKRRWIFASSPQKERKKYRGSVGVSRSSFRRRAKNPHLLFKFEEQLICVEIEGLDIFKMNGCGFCMMLYSHF